MVTLRFLGQSGFLISTPEVKLVIDPFITGNPLAKQSVADLQADFVLVTHAHGDHWGDTLSLAKQGATVVSTFEIAGYAKAQGAAKVIGMNIGGRLGLPGGWLKWTPAWHSSSFPDGSYGGMPMGVVLELANKRIYHSGDTALFSDMTLIGDMGLDLAILPIGDHFTMGPEDALGALELLNPKIVVPVHYNTFPPIQQDGQAFAEQASLIGVRGVALEPGEELSL